MTAPLTFDVENVGFNRKTIPLYPVRFSGRSWPPPTEARENNKCSEKLRKADKHITICPSCRPSENSVYPVARRKRAPQSFPTKKLENLCSLLMVFQKGNA